MYQSCIPGNLTVYFHSIPRISFEFTSESDPKFDLQNGNYVEGLAVISLIPVVILLVTMVAFVLYYYHIRTKTNHTSTHVNFCCPSYCVMITVTIAALISVGIIVYGNILIDAGLDKTLSIMHSADYFFSTLQTTLQDDSQQAIAMKTLTSEMFELNPHSSYILTLNLSAYSLEQAIFSLIDETEKVVDGLSWVMQIFQAAEGYRLIVTFTLISLIGCVCVFTLVGICFRSKNCLIGTTFVGQLCLVACYLYVGCLLAAVVAISDFCVNPFDYIEQKSIDSFYIRNDTIHYFKECLRNKSLKLPYTDALTLASAQLSDVHDSISNLTENFYDQPDPDIYHLGAKFYMLKETLQSMQKTFLCKSWQDVNNFSHQIVGSESPVHAFVLSMCCAVPRGLLLSLSALIALCIALTMMLCAAPRAWNRASASASAQKVNAEDNFPRTRSHPGTSNMKHNPNNKKIASRDHEINALQDQPPPYSVYY